MSNRVHLDAVPGLSLGQIKDLPAEELQMLQEELAEAEKKLKKQKDMLNAGINLKYSDREIAERGKAGKSFGIIRYADGDFLIESTQDKKVEWDQKQLAAVRSLIVDTWGADPGEYMETSYDVSERRYVAWPLDLQTVFASARTLKPGSKRITIRKAGG